MRPNLFLFDLDGTLVDTSPDLGGAVNDMRVARGLAPLPLETLRAPSGHGGPALLKAAFGMDRTDPKFESMRAEFLARYAERGASHSAVFPGVTDLLAALRAEDFACGRRAARGALRGRQHLGRRRRPCRGRSLRLGELGLPGGRSRGEGRGPHRRLPGRAS